MPLIKSISGLRGTIGGRVGESLTPVDITRFAAAYGTWLLKRTKLPASIVVGRDARSSGEMVSCIVVSTLRNLGFNVIDLGLASTPTVEVAVAGTASSGGIIITASHNPANWNALKLLNDRGEFLSEQDGNELLKIAEAEDFSFCQHDKTGSIREDKTWAQKHIEMVLSLKLTDTESIRNAKFKVVVDCINSVGSLVLPDLLRKLGVDSIVLLNEIPDGNFAHNPEPLKEHLQEISDRVISEKADLGFVVDPDVDRLAVVCEDGSMFGEEYTLVAVSDYVISNTPGVTVSNMSSTAALKDVTEQRGCRYYNSAVGEVNVVEEMKRRSAIIGGEGNGGIIYPEIHYGRDALVGIALFLSHIARKKISCSELRKSYPDYFMAKKKITMDSPLKIEQTLSYLKKHFKNLKPDERDGLRIDTDKGWVHIRKSNTEPVLRIYSESRDEAGAEKLAAGIIDIVKNL